MNPKSSQSIPKDKPQKRKAKASKGGRPTDYLSEYNDIVRKLFLLGYTDKQVFEFLGITSSTFYLWKQKHKKFSENVEAGKVLADANVALKMFDRATGASWIEEQAFKLKKVEYANGKKVSETESVKVVPVQRAAPPDTTAGISGYVTGNPPCGRISLSHPRLKMMFHPLKSR